jgi:hypothetical protein
MFDVAGVFKVSPSGAFLVACATCEVRLWRPPSVAIAATAFVYHHSNGSKEGCAEQRVTTYHRR